VWIAPKDQKVVGECLAAARKNAGVSQDELAARLGKPQSFVSTYERGQRRVDLIEFIVILTLLKADANNAFAEVVGRTASILSKRNPARRKARPESR